MFDKICSVIKHYIFTTNAIFICLILLFWFYGCQSQTSSPTDPSRSISRDTLESEVVAFNAKVSAAVKDLDRQDAMKIQILASGQELLEQGKVSTGGLLLLLGNILGIGSLIDNKRKDTIIKVLQSNGNSSKTDTT